MILNRCERNLLQWITERGDEGLEYAKVDEVGQATRAALKTLIEDGLVRAEAQAAYVTERGRVMAMVNGNRR